MRTEDIKPSELSPACIDVTSRDYNFSSENWRETRADGGGYTFTAPVLCEHCDQVSFGDGGYATCSNESCEMHEETIAEDIGPMMNYYYALPAELDHADIAKLVDLPLVYVVVDEQPGLALSGGGMDLSWEICEAFMRLGFLPPANFASLPAMSGRGESPRDQAIMAACRATADAAAERGRQTRASIIASIESVERLARVVERLARDDIRGS